MTKQKLLRKILFINVVSIFLIVLTGCQPPPKVKKLFVLAYTTDQNNINVRYAEVNNISNWIDGKFPSTILAEQGPGLAFDQSGIIDLVLTVAGNSINLEWGILPLWDNKAVIVPAVPAASSPVAANLGNDLWVITFIRKDNSLFIGIFDLNTKKIIVDVSTQLGELNTSIYGRPSIIVHDNKVLLAYTRNRELILFQGNFSRAMINFGNHQIIPTPEDNNENLLQGVSNDPVLANAGNIYYLVVQRERKSTRLKGWTTQWFQTSDGLTWVSRGFINGGIFPTSRGSYFGLAAAPDGTLLLACIKSTKDISVAQYSNGQWQQATFSNIMFNSPADWKPFSLVNNTQ
jgi:hypothetical protein